MATAPEVMGRSVHIVLEDESGRDAPGFERGISLDVVAEGDTGEEEGMTRIPRQVERDHGDHLPHLHVYAVERSSGVAAGRIGYAHLCLRGEVGPR